MYHAYSHMVKKSIWVKQQQDSERQMDFIRQTDRATTTVSSYILAKDDFEMLKKMKENT